MKNLIKSTAIAFLFVVSLTSMTPVPTTNLVISDEGKNLFIQLNSQLRGTTVSITDNSENTLFFADVYNGTYAKKFNLQQLADGTYFFTVDNPEASLVYKLNLKDDKVEIIQKEQKASPSAFRIDGDMVFFTLEKKDLKKVDIKITNSNNAEVFSKSETVDGSIDKVFNFEKAVKDSYTITIEDGKTTYFQHVEVAS
ncbi:hypothetical protein [Cyclobacterium jeungdonense]|uniref:Por secretion system C-terminal sorting domain-containing protein n=1 Tax=Cyclobacterium jeungdonense TaxID=708087 RepID=A0ABT8C6B8_9BACT|nr:hypothetical protein [Cyclobacterium jeungdonense]MDN3687226.1 hypothetical protein [Cyclobacterium jeungdonense]